MASAYEAKKLTKKEMKYQQNCELYRYTQSKNPKLLLDDSDYSNIFVRYWGKVFFIRRCFHFGEPRRERMICRSWGFHLLVVRCSTIILISMLLFLASAQDVNNHNVSSNSNAHPFNQISYFNSSSSQTILSTQYLSEPEKTNKSHQNNTNLDIKESLSSGYQHGISMNRNSLISGDNLLQRQLREKAKMDSLESIKMHILMRLNLKKLPNITKPISVPQNILENFYKNYNATRLKSTWRHDNANKPDLLNIADDILAKTTTTLNTTNKNIQSITNSEYAPDDLYNNSSLDMQGDDPNAFNEDQLSYNIEPNDQTSYPVRSNEESEDILSQLSSIYVFPEQLHVRHSRKPDSLRFKLASGYPDISFITLHLYIRGLAWINAHQPKIKEEVNNYQNKAIVVSLQRAIRRANGTNYTHKSKMFEFRHKIPTGRGQWVNVDLRPLFDPESSIISHGPNNTEEIIIKVVESWMKPLVVTTDSASKDPLTIHIEIGSRKKHRRKRSIFLDCTENDHDMGCCRYPLKVNFTSFGWHFVVAPTSFDAYFCSGDCRVGYLEQYPHTHLASLTTSATPCCSPTKMSSLSLLYFDDNHQLVLSVIPNMSVEECSCS